MNLIEAILPDQNPTGDPVAPTESSAEPFTDTTPAVLDPVDPDAVQEIATTQVPESPSTSPGEATTPWHLIIPPAMIVTIVLIVLWRLFRPKKSPSEPQITPDTKGQFKKTDRFELGDVHRQDFDKALDEFEEIEEIRRDSAKPPVEEPEPEQEVIKTKPETGAAELVGAHVKPANELDLSFEPQENYQTTLVKEVAAVTNDEFELNDELENFEDDDSSFDIDLSKHEVDGKLNLDAASNQELELEIEAQEKSGMVVEEPTEDEFSLSMADDEEALMNLEDDDSNMEIDIDVNELDLDDSSSTLEVETDATDNVFADATASDDVTETTALETPTDPDEASDESDDFGELFGDSDTETAQQFEGAVEVSVGDDDAHFGPDGSPVLSEQGDDELESDVFDFDLEDDEAEIGESAVSADSGIGVVSEKVAEIGGELVSGVSDAVGVATEEFADVTGASDLADDATDAMEAIGDVAVEGAVEGVEGISTEAKVAAAGAAAAGAAASGGFLSKIFGFLRPKKKAAKATTYETELAENENEVVLTDDVGEEVESVDAALDPVIEDPEDDAVAFAANFDDDDSADSISLDAAASQLEDGEVGFDLGEEGSAEFSFDDDEQVAASAKTVEEPKEEETGLKLEDSDDFSFEDEEAPTESTSMETVAEPEPETFAAAQTVREDSLDDEAESGAFDFDFDDGDESESVAESDPAEFASAKTVAEPNETDSALASSEDGEFDFLDEEESDNVEMDLSQDEFEETPGPDIVVSAATETLQETGDEADSELDQDFLEMDQPEIADNAIDVDEVEGKLEVEEVEASDESAADVELHDELEHLESMDEVPTEPVAEPVASVADVTVVPESESSGVVSAINDELDTLRSEFAKLKSQNETLLAEKTELVEASSGAASMTEELETLRSSLESVESEKAAVVSEMDGLKSQLDVVAGEKATLQTELDETKVALQEAKIAAEKAAEASAEAAAAVAAGAVASGATAEDISEDEKQTMGQADPDLMDRFEKRLKKEYRKRKEAEQFLAEAEEQRNEIAQALRQTRMDLKEAQEKPAASDISDETKQELERFSEELQLLSKSKDELSSELGDANKALDELRGKVADLENEKATIAGEKESLQTAAGEAESLKTKVSELEEQLTAQKTDLDLANQAASEIEGLKSELATKQTEVETAQNALQTLETENAELAKTSEELKATIEKSASEIAEREQADSAAAAKLDELKREAETALADLESAKRDAGELQQKAEAAVAERQAAMDKLSDLERNRESEKSQLLEAVNTLSSVRAELAASEAKLAEHTAAPKLDEELEGVRGELAAEKSEKAEAFRQIENQRRTIAKLESEASSVTAVSGVEQQLREELQSQERRILELEAEHDAAQKQIDELRKRPTPTAFEFDTATAPKKASTKKSTTRASAKSTEKKTPAKKTAKGSSHDDLTEINGIGPVLRDKLYRRKITTFEQIAAWTKAEAEEWDSKLDRSRVVKDEWVKQAKALAKKKK